MGGEDDGFAALPRPRHGVPEQTPGHGVHAGGGLVQEDDGGAADQGDAGAQLPLVATAAGGDGEGPDVSTEKPRQEKWRGPLGEGVGARRGAFEALLTCRS